MDVTSHILEDRFFIGVEDRKVFFEKSALRLDTLGQNKRTFGEDLVQGYFLNRSFEQLSGRGRTIGPERRRAAYRPLAAKRFRAKREKSRAAPDLRK